jgi:integrase
MRAIIGAKLLSGSQTRPQTKPFEIRDSRLSGFILRVQPSGVRAYIAQIGRGRRVTIGKVGHFTPDEARERCEKILGNVAHGREPLSGMDGADATLLGDFVADVYAPWLRANRPRNAEDTLARIKRHFSKWYALPLTELTVERIEQWKTERREAGKSASTVLRDIAALSGVLSRAVKLGKLDASPMPAVDKPRIDRNAAPRFLDKAEEKRLRAALDERDGQMIAARRRANEWRKARKRDALPVPASYGDHLTPAVLLSINTGLRRGELLALRWEDVDLKAGLLAVRGGHAKNAQTRHVDLNSEAKAALKAWREQRADKAEPRVFAVGTSFKTAWAALLTRAKITEFRWHDLRHHFASRLVQAGVPLNTTRDLLGHGSLTMTLRYAHLAPDNRRKAVEKLVNA